MMPKHFTYMINKQNNHLIGIEVGDRPFYQSFRADINKSITYWSRKEDYIAFKRQLNEPTKEDKKVASYTEMFFDRVFYWSAKRKVESEKPFSRQIIYDNVTILEKLDLPFLLEHSSYKQILVDFSKDEILIWKERDINLKPEYCIKQCLHRSHYSHNYDEAAYGN